MVLYTPSALTARQILGERRWADIYSPIEEIEVLKPHQVRVLRLLSEVDGPISRPSLADMLSCSQTYIGKTVGYSDPIKRAEFEQSKDGGGSPGNPCPSLLTLGYVREEELVGDVTETVLHITAAGRKALAELGDIDLPPLRD